MPAAATKAKRRAACTPEPPATPAPREMPKGMVAWKPGQSGNPAGRPKDRFKVAELARSYAPQCIERLVQIAFDAEMNGEPIPAKVALDAVTRLLDRGVGRSMSTKEISVSLDGQAADFVSALRDIAKRPRITIEQGEVVEVDAQGTDSPPDEPPA